VQQYRSIALVLLIASFPSTYLFAGEPSKKMPLDKAATDRHALETANFIIQIRTGQEELGSQVGECAERVRSDLWVAWFAQENRPQWTPKCQIVLHASRDTFADATENRASSSGYSTTHSNRGRVISQRIDLLLDGSDLLHTVLPHELAHVLLSYHFVRRPLPLWAEEGLAVMAETHEMKNAHLQNLDAYARRGALFTAQELMALREYPADHLRGVFYAQSVSLVDYFINRRGTSQFIEYLSLAGRQGNEVVLQRIYGISSIQLNQDWLASTATVDKLGLSR